MAYEMPEIIEVSGVSGYGINWWPPEIFVANIGKVADFTQLQEKIQRRCQQILDAGSGDVTWIRIDIEPAKLYIEVDGVNGCYVLTNGGVNGGETSSHNIDTMGQCSVLYACLTLIAAEVINNGPVLESQNTMLPESAKWSIRLKRSPHTLPFRIYQISDDIWSDPVGYIFARTTDEAAVHLSKDENYRMIYQVVSKPKRF